MSKKTSRLLLILEAIIIATPLTGLAILASILLTTSSYDLVLGILAIISLFAIGSGWRLFIIFFRRGVNELKSQHFGWWVIIFVGVLVAIGSLISNLLPPSPEYSRWWMFRLSFDGFVYGLPMFIPFCHLALESLLRKSNS